jgi:hypothetical protein
VSEQATLTRLRGKSFKDLENEVKQIFWKYQFAVEYVPSDDEGIINDIFNRINRNVSKLTPQELRHARFNGGFITTVEDLTDWMASILPPNFPSIPARARNQMKDVEFVALLLLFLEEGVKSYRQDDLDKAFNDRDLAWEEQDEIKSEFKQVILSIKELLARSPQHIHLSKTRLKNQADFYSFFSAIAELNREKLLKNITADICQRIYEFMETVKSPESAMITHESQAYYDAITTSLGSSEIEKTKTRINILKSVILGNTNSQSICKVSNL